MVRDVYIYYIILCVLTVIPAELDHDVGTRRVHPVRRGFDQTVTLGRNKILRSNRSVSPRTAGGGRGSQCSTRVYIHNDTRIRFYCRPVRCENRSGKKKNKQQNHTREQRLSYNINNSAYDFLSVRDPFRASRNFIFLSPFAYFSDFFRNPAIYYMSAQPLREQYTVYNYTRGAWLWHQRQKRIYNCRCKR